MAKKRPTKLSVSVQKALTGLIEKNLVERENGLIVLSDVFFKRWLQKLA
jgi:hypothetical protein